MELYRDNRGQPWTKGLQEDQLYAVYQCHAEDMIYQKDDFEYPVLESYLDKVSKERKKMTDSQRPDTARTLISSALQTKRTIDGSPSELATPGSIPGVERLRGSETFKENMMESLSRIEPMSAFEGQSIENSFAEASADESQNPVAEDVDLSSYVDEPSSNASAAANSLK